jgi:hypothetical protein
VSDEKPDGRAVSAPGGGSDSAHSETWKAVALWKDERGMAEITTTYHNPMTLDLVLLDLKRRHHDLKSFTAVKLPNEVI